MSLWCLKEHSLKSKNVLIIQPGLIELVFNLLWYHNWCCDSKLMEVIGNRMNNWYYLDMNSMDSRRMALCKFRIRTQLWVCCVTTTTRQRYRPVTAGIHLDVPIRKWRHTTTFQLQKHHSIIHYKLTYISIIQYKLTYISIRNYFSMHVKTVRQIFSD